MGNLKNILQNLADLERVRRILPIWTDWGVEGSGVSIHSLGVSYLAHAGMDLGFCAVTEIPAPRKGVFEHITADVRSDSAWFDRASQRVILLAEFERFAGTQKDLSPKVENLLLAQHRWKKPDAILLMAYWTVGLVALPDHAFLRNIISRGYETQLREEVAGGSGSCLCFLQFIMQRGKDNLLRLSKIVVRGE
jgi:hypothetical protein